jgi:hypothetical protein
VATTATDPTKRRRWRKGGLVRRTTGVRSRRALAVSEVDDIFATNAFWHGAFSMRVSIGSSSAFDFWCARHVNDDPWIVVGHFVSGAVEDVVAKDPSLPALPDDLSSEPESTDQGQSRELHPST